MKILDKFKEKFMNAREIKSTSPWSRAVDLDLTDPKNFDIRNKLILNRIRRYEFDTVILNKDGKNQKIKGWTNDILDPENMIHVVYILKDGTTLAANFEAEQEIYDSYQDSMIGWIRPPFKDPEFNAMGSYPKNLELAKVVWNVMREGNVV